jgi:hypothetical protein
MVLYKGRGIEWFPAEIPVMFDWMSRKKRANGTATLQLGNGPRLPWRTIRSTDNRFYWLGVDKIQDKHTLDTVPPGTPIVPAQIQGDIKGTNVIDIHSQAITQLSVWLSQEMIDWTKPVTVNIGGRVARDPAGKEFRGRKLEPDLEVLLDDYRERGDRRMLYTGRLQFNASP